MSGRRPPPAAAPQTAARQAADQAVRLDRMAREIEALRKRVEALEGQNQK